MGETRCLGIPESLEELRKVCAKTGRDEQRALTRVVLGFRPVQDLARKLDCGGIPRLVQSSTICGNGRMKVIGKRNLPLVLVQVPQEYYVESSQSGMS